MADTSSGHFRRPDSWDAQDEGARKERERFAQFMREEAEIITGGLKGKPDELWEDGYMCALQSVAQAMDIDFLESWERYTRRRMEVKRDV